MKRCLALATLISLVTVPLANAQELPKPGPEQEHLQQRVGTWDAVMDSNGQKSKAVATYKSVCNGMWVASDYEGSIAEGVPFQGHGLDGYDSQKKKYVSIWVDSVGSPPMQVEGDYDAKAKQFVLSGESRGFGGTPQKVKNVTELKDKDHFTFRMYLIQPDGGEILAFTVEYTRRK